MKYVSLLPPEIKSKRLLEKKQGLIIRVLLIVMLFVLLGYSFLFVSSIMAGSNLDSLQQQRVAAERQAEALAEYEELYNQMISAENALNSAMGTAPSWSQLLRNIGESLFPFARLTDMTVNYGAGGGTINLRGLTGTHQDVALMLERIEQLDMFDNVLCRTSSATTTAAGESTQFVVEAIIIPGELYLDNNGEGG